MQDLQLPDDERATVPVAACARPDFLARELQIVDPEIARYAVARSAG
jgi:hypothetical protein